MILNKTVDIKGYGLGPYNRILSVIHLGDKNVNLEMGKAGYAEVYRGKPPRGLNVGPFQQAEAEAKNSGRAVCGHRGIDI